MEIDLKQSLLIAVVLCTLKRRSLIQGFVSVNIWPELTLLTAGWYLRYNLTFHNSAEIMEERRLSMAHKTIMRWYINNS